MLSPAIIQLSIALRLAALHPRPLDYLWWQIRAILDGVVQGLGRPDEDTRRGFTQDGWGQRYQDEVMNGGSIKAGRTADSF